MGEEARRNCVFPDRLHPRRKVAGVWAPHRRPVLPSTRRRQRDDRSRVRRCGFARRASVRGSEGTGGRERAADSKARAAKQRGRLHNEDLGRNGARGGSRTRTGFPTCPSNMRVCQFRHPSTTGGSENSHYITPESCFSTTPCQRGATPLGTARPMARAVSWTWGSLGARARACRAWSRATSVLPAA